MLAIETSGLTKRFASLAAVDRVGLAVPEQAVYGFLGPNGAGKTTSIRLLLGLLRPTGGDVRLFGRDIRRERLAALAQVGAMVESPSLYDHLSGRDNVEVTRLLRGLPKSETDRVITLVGLAGAQGRAAGKYSLGMRQRLALARALLGSPKLLILDEPTNGLDPDGIQEIRELVRGLPARTGATVFLSSHLLSEVEQTATHIGVMSKGRLVLQDALATALGDGRSIDVDVEEPARARALITEAKPGVLVSADGPTLRLRLSTEGDASHEIAALNALLVGAGIGVFRIAPHPRSLEDVYMAHVGAHAREEADVPRAA